jgi:hypothetical protein
MQFREAQLEQDVIYEQFNNVPPETPPTQQVIDVAGAITALSTNTLNLGLKSGGVQPVDLPQPLGPASNPTFNSINTVDDPTTRSNLGLGNLATQNRGVAVANLAGAISNPPTQAEVQANRDKINELLTSLRNAGIIST